MLRQLIVLMLLTLSLSGCFREKVYTRLSEQEANEMLSLLSHAGIDAGKEELDKQLYAVVVPKQALPNAIDILRANGYPRNKFKSIGEVFEKEGLISSALEERARLNYAQSQELTKTLESIDGVVLARVHLALPEQDKLSKKHKPSSASVFIKHHAESDFSDQESQIKALVVNSIEGLPYENVTVVFSPSDINNEKYTAVAATNDNTLILLLVIFVALLLLYWLFNTIVVHRHRFFSREKMLRD